MTLSMSVRDKERETEREYKVMDRKHKRNLMTETTRRIHNLQE